MKDATAFMQWFFTSGSELTVQAIKDGSVVAAVTYSLGGKIYRHIAEHGSPQGSGCKVVGNQYCEVWPVLGQEADHVRRQTTEEGMYRALEELLSYSHPRK